jgi:hypothetical protein
MKKCLSLPVNNMFYKESNCLVVLTVNVGTLLQTNLTVDNSCNTGTEILIRPSKNFMKFPSIIPFFV